MCPIWPLHLIIMYLLALCPLWVICQAVPKLTAEYLPDNVNVTMDGFKYVNINLTGSGLTTGDKLTVRSIDPHLLGVEWASNYQPVKEVTVADPENSSWKEVIRINGSFIGRTNIEVSAVRDGTSYPITNGTHPVIILRPVRVIDTVFNYSVAIFISLIFINFGCAMHWPTVLDVLRRPIGPAIGMVGQFLFMPLISFGLGYLIFPNSPALRLGLFFTGVSPGGGASNVWTFLLGGNLNMSLALTSISTFACFGFMPLWLFSLGQVVFHNAHIVVPYARIGSLVMALIVPLAIGLGMQKWTPKFATFMVRILKGFSTTLLLGIIVFAIVTNLYIFELFSWEIVVAGMGLPWLGYIAGYLFAKLFKQTHPDALAISIETGIQNTGIAIFLLRYALGQPEADLTTVVPVSCAIMTPIPMTAMYIYQKIRQCIVNGGQPEKVNEDIATIPTSPKPSLRDAFDVEKEQN